jgi:hypothetical protein
MKIKTKYNIGDEVYFVENEKIKNATIGRIYIGIDETKEIKIEYRYLKSVLWGTIYTTIMNPKKNIEELEDK